MKFDLIIAGGFIIDGSGDPRFKGDIGIVEERIAAIGNLKKCQANKQIDARDLCISPGFIDTHVHSDLMLLERPKHKEKLLQGVTTEILGQDGLSYAPLSKKNLKFYRYYLAGLNGNPNINFNWSSVKDFRKRFDRKVTVNTAYLVPHGALRLESVGMKDVELNKEQLNNSKNLLAQGLKEGAVGFSTGLSYYPNSWSDTEELIELCRVVSSYNKVFVIHLRTVFKGDYFDPVEEALEISRKTGVKLHISHYRTKSDNAGKVKQLLAPIEQGIKEGLDITIELYPYPSGSSKLLMVLPPWVHEGGIEDIISRLKKPSLRNKIISNFNPPLNSNNYDKLILSHLCSEKNQWMLGQSISDVSSQIGCCPGELICNLLIEENLEVGFFAAPPSDLKTKIRLAKDKMEILARPYAMVGSDSIHVGNRVHPRTFGAFPRFLGLYRKKYGKISLEKMINRMTLLPAKRFGLEKRGLLEVGKSADIVVFDPDQINDLATYNEPQKYSKGINFVIINGDIIIDNGTQIDNFAGRSIG